MCGSTFSTNLHHVTRAAHNIFKLRVQGDVATYAIGTTLLGRTHDADDDDDDGFIGDSMENVRIYTYNNACICERMWRVCV